MRRMRLMWAIIRRSGASKALGGFLVIYLVCAFVVLMVEPDVSSYGDALWFLWAVSTTVGLGDVTAQTMAGRLAAIVCSVFAVITTAILTGVIVDYFHETRQQQLDQSLVEFLDKLERLPELDHDELTSLAERVKAFRK